MLDLERFRLLKAMEDKNTPKKDKNFPRLRKKKFCQKHQRKRNFGYGWREKGPKKNRMFMKVIFAKGLK